MKNKFLIALLLLCGGATLAEQITVTDSDAESYIQNRYVTDTNEIAAIHGWFKGLKNLNLWSDVVYSASYRSQHNSVSNTTSLYPFVGGVGTISGSVPQSTNGLTFSLNSANFVTFNNPMQSATLAGYTIVSGFDAVQGTATFQAIVDSYNSAGTLGPGLWALGSPNAGLQTTMAIYSSATTDGTTGLAGQTSNEGQANTIGLTTGPQICIACVTNTYVAMTSGFDGTRGTYALSLGTIWNNNATWRIGLDLAGLKPLQGNVGMITLIKRPLQSWEAHALRRLYAKTIGAGYIPTVNFIFEGDSLTDGSTAAGVATYRHVRTNELWRTKVGVRNISTGGTTSSQHWTDYPTQAAPAKVEFDYVKTQYYWLLSGLNDVGSLSSDTIFSNVRSNWANARADGFKVVACTLPPTTTILASQTQNDRRLRLNDLIRSTPSGYDVLIDLARVPELLDPSNSTYYQGDGTHPTTVGFKIYEREIMKVLGTP